MVMTNRVITKEISMYQYKEIDTWIRDNPSLYEHFDSYMSDGIIYRHEYVGLRKRRDNIEKQIIIDRIRNDNGRN